MQRTSNPFKHLAIAAVAATFATAGFAANLSQASFEQARTELRDTYKTERDACQSQSGNAKDVCVEKAKGREKVALAHLQHQRTGDAKDMSKLNEARVEARYELAKEMCDDQTGQAQIDVQRAGQGRARQGQSQRQNVQGRHRSPRRSQRRCHESRLQTGPRALRYFERQRQRQLCGQRQSTIRSVIER